MLHGFILDITDQNLYNMFHKGAEWRFNIDDWVDLQPDQIG